MTGANPGGIPVSSQSVEAIAAVYGCCSLIAGQVSALPVELRNGPKVADSTSLKLSPLLEQPYAEVSRIDWWKQFMWALALRGNFYGQIIERDRLKYPVQVKPIHNDAVQVRRLQGGQLEYRYYGLPVPLDDVVHVRYQSTSGNIIGLNPIEVCALAFGLALAHDRYAESFYLNQATPYGVIEVPGPLDRVETKKMMRGWLAAHQNINKAHLPAILTEGAEFKPVTISPENSQMLEAMRFSEERICGRIFRVPPHMVGIVEKESSFGRGLEQTARNFFENTLGDYVAVGQEALTRLHPPRQYVHLDLKDRLRGTTLERAQAAALVMNSGIAVADETRDWFDWPALPEGQGQHLYIPINTQLIEQALLVLQQTEQAPEGEGQEQIVVQERGAKNGHMTRARALAVLRAAAR